MMVRYIQHKRARHGIPIQLVFTMALRLPVVLVVRTSNMEEQGVTVA